MHWTDRHDVLLCREVILLELYKQKTGSRERGQALENITEDLNNITEVNFNVSKRSVRDRLNLLVENFKKVDRENEKASGIDVQETELEQILREITERQHEAELLHEKDSSDKKKTLEAERANAQEQRKRAMEALGETNLRRSSELEDENSAPKKSRRTGSETVTYLREKFQQEFEMRQKEVEAKKEETKVLQEFLKANVSNQNNGLQQQITNMQQLLQTQNHQQKFLFDHQQQMQQGIVEQKNQFQEILELLRRK